MEINWEIQTCLITSGGPVHMCAVFQIIIISLHKV